MENLHLQLRTDVLSLTPLQFRLLLRQPRVSVLMACLGDRRPPRESPTEELTELPLAQLWGRLPGHWLRDPTWWIW